MRLYRGLDCGRSGAPVRYVMRAETHAHVLRLEKHLVTPGPALPADAGGLGAAEGLAQVTHVLAVDETHAGLDGRCDAVRATEILAPHVAAQAVLDIVGLGNGVGFVAEGDAARHGYEDLLLRNTQAIVNVPKDGLPHIVAGAYRGWQLGRVGRALEAAAKQRCTFVRACNDVAADFGQVILADHRTNERSLIEWVADTDAPRAFREPGREIGVDGPLHQNARAGGAALTVVREDHEERSIERTREIGVLEHHERALAAQLHTELLESRAPDDPIARYGRAGEGDCAHLRMLAERLTGVLAGPVHHIQDAAGNSGLEREIPEARRRDGRELAHLQHRGVAEGERRGDLPGGRHERHVPGRDQRAHADRLK